MRHAHAGAERLGRHASDGGNAEVCRGVVAPAHGQAVVDAGAAASRPVRTAVGRYRDRYL
ncbi:hypothetical protein NW249_11095 [Streptomyces sp. OUCMDZ-4982]|uniref:hypothetical protein n=1 Tax=Streptomyces sp. OUCMDZ-4982 TaxID=2973090 RepID=UPI00215BE177|nr:hypothetical protein [Streptomyces sp. OUCMDZ-4982]MCR8942668.1 hypothetical protein [Streptomyces sp. OUCMDZ-4982]